MDTENIAQIASIAESLTLILAMSIAIVYLAKDSHFWRNEFLRRVDLDDAQGKE
jgi:hypothetical protein